MADEFDEFRDLQLDYTVRMLELLLSDYRGLYFSLPLIQCAINCVSPGHY